MSGCSTRARIVSVAIALGALASPDLTLAQQPDPWQGFRFPDRRLPEPTDPSGTPPLQVLPPVDPSLIAPEGDAGPRFTLRGVRFIGNTVFDDEALARLAQPFLGRAVSTDELLALRHAITRRYVEAGYIGSGARIPDQVPTAGVVTFEIVESQLAEIEIEGATRVRPAMIERRLALERDRPLRLDRIERRIRLLQSDLRLARLDARLEPGDRPGLDRLVVSVEERAPRFVSGETGTLVSPAIGGYAGRIGFDLESPLGLADRLRSRISIAEGLVDLEGLFEIPLNRYDMTVAVRGRYGLSRVVAAPLDDLEIETRFLAFGIELRQPVWRERDQRIELGVIGDWRDARAEVGGRSLSLTEGAGDGDFRVAALRIFAAGTFQTPRQVLSARSTWSVGLDALGATTRPGPIEDGRFFAWLGQLQLLRSLEPWPIDILLRGNVQLATDRLLPVERYAVGGHDTVRGYRENLFVRDNGANGSLEIRWPIVRGLDRRRIVELAAFVDAGVSWEDRREDDRSDRLAALGVALRYAPGRWGGVELSYARRVIDKPSVLDRDLQDTGAYFRIELRTP